MPDNNPLTPAQNPAPAQPQAAAPQIAAPAAPAAPIQPQPPEFNLDTAFTDAVRANQQLAPAPAAPVAPVVPAAPAIQQPQVSPHVVQARQLGLNVPDNATPDQVLAIAMDQYRQQQPFAQYGQSIMAQGGVRQEQPAPAQSAEPPKFSAEEHFKKLYNLPQWKDQFDNAIQSGMVQRDQNGMFVATPGYEMMVAPILSELNHAHRAQAQQWQQIMRGNPYEQFYKAMLEPMRNSWQQDVDAAIARAMQQSKQEQEVSRFETENSSWMYGKNAAGQIDFTQTSPEGQKFFDAAKTLQAAGVTDPNKLAQLAMQMIGRSPNGVQQQPQQPNPPAAPVVPTPQSPPAIPNQVPQQPAAPAQQSFLDEAMRRAMYGPNTGAAPVQSPDTPVHLSEGDLENMFSNAYHASANGVPATAR